MLSDAQLSAFRTRCMKAAGYGHTVARANEYMAALSDEVGSKPCEPTAAALRDLASEALQLRAGGKKKKRKTKAKAKPAAPPPPPPPEPTDSPEAAPEVEVAPESGEVPPYPEWTKKELYAEADDRDIDGRSGMNKAELVAALEADDEAQPESVSPGSPGG